MAKKGVFPVIATIAIVGVRGWRFFADGTT